MTRSRSVSAETSSMVMLLSTRLLIEGAVSDEMLGVIISRLMKGSGENGSKSLFDFIVIVWQRRAGCIKNDIV